MNVASDNAGFSHDALDKLRLSMSLTVARGFTPNEIRRQILINLS